MATVTHGYVLFQDTSILMLFEYHFSLEFLKLKGIWVLTFTYLVNRVWLSKSAIAKWDKGLV